MEDVKEATRSALESAAGETQRAVDEVRDLLEFATAEDLAERSAAVRAKLHEARAALTRNAAQASESLRPILQDAEREFHEEIEVIEARVRDNPLGALLAAAGVGLLLGLAFSRKR